MARWFITVGVLLNLGFAAAAVRQEALPETPAIRYEHRRTNQPFSIHIAEVDPRKVRIVAKLAAGSEIGRGPVSSTAKRESALLAINGGFFRIGEPNDGDPSGVLKVDGRWVSDSPLPRAAIAWSEDSARVLFGQLTTRWRLRTEAGELAIAGLNRVRGNREVLVFNRLYGLSTRTRGGVEWRVRDGRVESVQTSGDSQIPPDGFVVSFGNSMDVPALAPGSTVTLSFHSEGADAHLSWEAADFVVGGTPLLIRDGEPVRDFSSERIRRDFVEAPHPRTAVGVREDGTWVFVVVDGRRPEFSAGMTLSQLTDLMLELGCRNALNLDGGGSSTFWIYGQVVNRPADLAGERHVSDAILVLPDGD